MASDRNIVSLQSNETDFANLIKRAHTETELFSVCARMGRYFGLPYFAVVRDPTEIYDTLERIMMFSNWPAPLISEYDRNRLLDKSVMVSHIRTSIEPYVFRFKDAHLGEFDDETFLTASIFRTHNMSEGVFFAFRINEVDAGAVSFCGDDEVLSREVIRKLDRLCNVIFTQLHEIRNKNAAALKNLTSREIECLTWLSKGKQTAEIAFTLTLSEVSVLQCVDSAINKLGCKTLGHAISEAIRAKII
ncbi:MAG: autoinducer binding domain-containing protein [Pseudomonadota bacterium]